MASELLNAAQLQRLERLEVLVEHLNAQLAERDAENAALRAELKEWCSGVRIRGKQRKRRRVRGARDAHEAAEKGEEVGNRRSGRKTGHKGSGRKKPESIDKTEHRMLESCPDCNGPLTDEGIAHRHTVEDIVLRVETTEYRQHRHHCAACNNRHIAPLPTELGGPVRIGPKALALAAWLRFELGQSIGKISRLFTEGISLKWSAGSISKRLTALTVQMAPVVDQLWDDLLDENVLHVDETGWREDGWRAWLWSASGQNTACAHITGYRDRDSFEQLVPTTYQGFVMTDGYTAYNAIDEGKHAGCWAHHLRKARDAWEVHKHPEDEAVFIAVTQFLRGARWYQASWSSNDAQPVEHIPLLKRAYAKIIMVCQEAKTARLVRMGVRLSRKRRRYLLFLDHKPVPLTNNQAERELRLAVIMRKTSFGSRNATGSKTLADGWTITRSIRKRGGNLFEFLPRAFKSLADGIVPALVLQPA